MPKVSAEHKQAVRRRILDAALTCLQHNDYHDVTTREILAEAGLSIGTFYNYFPTKDHLYEALAEDALAGDIATILARTESGDAVADALFGFLRHLALVDNSGTVAVAMFRARVQGDAESRQAIDRLNGWVVREFTPLVQAGQSDGSLRADLDTEATVEMIDLLWDGLGRRAATGTFQTSYDRVAAAILDVLRNGLSPRPR